MTVVTFRLVSLQPTLAGTPSVFTKEVHVVKASEINPLLGPDKTGLHIGMEDLRKREEFMSSWVGYLNDSGFIFPPIPKESCIV